MATMKDVAALAGVSTATVSHVINQTKHISARTSSRVMDAIRQTHYEPHPLAQSLRRGKSFSVGVLVEDIRVLPVPEIVGGIDEVLEKMGYHVLLNDLRLYERIYNRYARVREYRERINRGAALLLKSRVDGVIYVGMHDQHVEELLDPIDCPLVYAYSHGAPTDYYVCYDNVQGARSAMECLLAAGHREVAVLAGHPDSDPTRRRMEGVRAALTERGLTLNRERLIYGDWEYPSGQRAARQLLGGGARPTAVFAMNDRMAAGLVNEAGRMGVRVPEELSVVGFDDREIAALMDHPLTTVQLPLAEIGRTSANMLTDLIAGKRPAQNRQILSCNLIARASVAPPPQTKK